MHSAVVWFVCQPSWGRRISESKCQGRRCILQQNDCFCNICLVNRLLSLLPGPQGAWLRFGCVLKLLVICGCYLQGFCRCACFWYMFHNGFRSLACFCCYLQYFSRYTVLYADICHDSWRVGHHELYFTMLWEALGSEGDTGARQKSDLRCSVEPNTSQAFINKPAPYIWLFQGSASPLLYLGCVWGDLPGVRPPGSQLRSILRFDCVLAAFWLRFERLPFSGYVLHIVGGSYQCECPSACSCVE